MTRLSRHIIALLCGMVMLGGCQPAGTDWRVSLSKEDKRPYGTYLAYNSLQYYFPLAKIEALPGKFRYTSMTSDMKYNYNGTSLLVLVGLNFFISEEEWEQLRAFARQGNEILLFCSSLDDQVEKQLHCTKRVNGMEEYRLSANNDGKENIGALRLMTDSAIAYGYEGHTINGYFDLDDDSDRHTEALIEKHSALVISSPTVLGRADGKPDFLSYKVGEGHILLHAAPLALSNYFLLQGNNRRYYDAILNALPNGIDHIYWHEYFKRTASQETLGVLFKYPATTWAFWLALALLLLYVLFQSKRKQKIIPVIEPLKNESVSFVETVGRLYYNEQNHANIALKMNQQLLEWVRTNYRINTNQLNEAFEHELAVRSGQPLSVVSELVKMIHDVRLGNVQVDEAYLYHLYNTIQLFYRKQ